LANAESKCRELAAESDKTSERMQQLIQIINNADNDYCMCGDAMKNHTHGGCGHPTGMFDYYYNQWLQAENKTPATDAFLAEVRAQGVEIYADNLDSSADDAERDGFDDAVKFLRSEASGVRLFAAQLRKGTSL
ncbi:hNH endonuclease, partial [Citrobacter freundii]|uniref:hNH endonuclease n=1 Tax=Citrobacter freundii TaxID=546 RepID=UPI003D78F34A